MIVTVVAGARTNCPSGDNCVTPVNPHFFTVTDDSGRFTLNWLDKTRNAFPVPLLFKATYVSSAQDGGMSTTMPAALFRVVRDPNTSPEDVFKLTATGPLLAAGPVTVTAALADEESAAYLTAREFFENIVARSAVLRDGMPGLTVKTRVQGFFMFRGLTPVANEVWITDGSATSAPLTVAHEMGHAVTWTALQLRVAPINPVTDYVMNGIPGWERDSREFSKAAFLEGMADLWSMVWRFGQVTEPVFQVGDKTLHVESAKITDGRGTVTLDCARESRAWEFPFCHTAALWDLIDRDRHGDGVDFGVATIVDTLKRFPNGCITNGCRDELGLDGLNHLDFQRNASPAARRASIGRVWHLNGIDGGF